MSKKYIVTKDNPYYPSVKYFNNYEDALVQANEWAELYKEDDGEHDTKIVIAEVLTETQIKTYY